LQPGEEIVLDGGLQPQRPAQPDRPNRGGFGGGPRI